MSLSPSTTDALAQKLADSGLRATPQREMVYNVLLSQRDHPTADQVFTRVKERMPTISLATVYNCLETLVQCGLVRQVNFERDSTRFCPNLREHAHFHDDQSGATYDIDLPAGLLEQLTAILPPGYAVERVELSFHGHSSRA